jgi:fermentation-respiration switch protein FrsA (DUF1100 family)
LRKCAQAWALPQFTVFICLSVALLFTRCSSFLYYPTHQLHFPPERQKLTPEELWIPTGISSTEKLFAWYFHSGEKPHALVIFFHGNGENMSSHYLGFTWLLKQNYDLLVFDYRGYGRSAGNPSPQNTVEDGKSIVRWAAKNHPQLSRILYGQSLGAAIALRTAIDLKFEIPIHLVIADSGFLSYQKVARKTLAGFWLTWIFQPLAWITLTDTNAPGDRVSEIAPTPLVVIHGDHDTVVPFELGQEIYNKSHPPKELWIIPNGKHIDSMRLRNNSIKIKLLKKLNSIFKLHM